jgi:hypothetical protein
VKSAICYYSASDNHSGNGILVAGVFTKYKMPKKLPFEGILGAFLIVLYGISGPFDPGCVSMQ